MNVYVFRVVSCKCDGVISRKSYLWKTCKYTFIPHNYVIVSQQYPNAKSAHRYKNAIISNGMQSYINKEKPGRHQTCTDISINLQNVKTDWVGMTDKIYESEFLPTQAYLVWIFNTVLTPLNEKHCFTLSNDLTLLVSGLRIYSAKVPILC